MVFGVHIKWIFHPHLLIPISSFIKKFIVDEEKVDFLTITGLLIEQEFEVVRQIRKKMLSV